MFWYISQVKHLLRLNETGALHHWFVARVNREAGCDSKTEEAAESAHLHVGKGGTCHMVSQISFPSAVVAKTTKLTQTRGQEYTLCSYDTTTARLSKRDEVNVKR